MRPRAKRTLTSAGLLFAFLHSSVQAQQAGSNGGDLVQKARNPLADLVSVQVQPNFNFGVGQSRDTEYVVNLQPNIPIHLPGEWNLIARTIVPLLNEPPSEPGQGYTFGIGDIQTTLFVSPPSSTMFIWGVGPVFQFPSASATSHDYCRALAARAAAAFPARRAGAVRRCSRSAPEPGSG